MMGLFDLETWQKNLRALGVIAIIVGVGAWALDLTGAVYVCPYCRVQRSVIAVLGVFMLFPHVRHWIVRYVAFVIGFLGAVVAANQNFSGWSRISQGEFTWGEQWYLNSFLLSGAALFIIIGQVWLLLMNQADSANRTGDS
jgi:disulfide bond formation protein DsbB